MIGMDFMHRPSETLTFGRCASIPLRLYPFEVDGERETIFPIKADPEAPVGP